MCRNYQEYKWKPCWSQIGTLQKSVSELFLKMVTLRVEDGVKRKTLQLQSCRKFHGKRSGYKIHLIPSPDGRDKPAPLRPKMGRRKSERLYKGRRENSLFDTTLKSGSLFDTKNYSLPYLAPSLIFFPYMTSPLVPLGFSVKWDKTTPESCCIKFHNIWYVWRVVHVRPINRSSKWLTWLRYHALSPALNRSRSTQLEGG
jgi:hypothetical protein